MSTALLVAEEAGLPTPDRPAPINVPEGASERLSELAWRCNRLLDLARQVTQPSEPLADRWTRAWADLLAELDALEDQLRRTLNGQ